MRNGRTVLAIVMLACVGILAFATGQQQAAVPERMTITTIAYNVQGYPGRSGSFAELELERRLGIEIEVWEGVDIYAAEQIQVRIAGGDVPDLWNGNTMTLREIGAIREIPESAIRTHMPSYIRQVEEVGGPLAWSNVILPDGKNYGIPTALSIAAAGPSMALRSDWLANVGWSGPIDTLDQLEEVLLRFVRNDPNRTGVADTYGYSDYKNSASLYPTAFAQLFGAYGVRIRTWEIHGDEIRNSMISTGYRDALTHLARWYQLGIIHPDYPVHTRQQTGELLLNDRMGAHEEYSSWTSSPTGPMGLLTERHPGLEWVHVVSPAGPTGIRGNYSRPAAPWGQPGVIGFHVSDAKMNRILEVIDAVYTDPVLYGLVFRAGLQGQHWEVDPASGAAYWLGDAGEAAKWAERGTGLFRTNAVLPLTDYIYMDVNRYPVHDWIRRNEVALDFGFAPVWNETQNLRWADIQTHESEFYFGVMTGRINLAQEWNNYVNRWLQLGGTDLLAEATRQYRARRQ